jgi:hypothetical protein
MIVTKGEAVDTHRITAMCRIHLRLYGYVQIRYA